MLIGGFAKKKKEKKKQCRDPIGRSINGWGLCTVKEADERMREWFTLKGKVWGRRVVTIDLLVTSWVGVPIEPMERMNQWRVLNKRRTLGWLWNGSASSGPGFNIYARVPSITKKKSHGSICNITSPNIPKTCKGSTLKMKRLELCKPLHSIKEVRNYGLSVPSLS